MVGRARRALHWHYNTCGCGPLAFPPPRRRRAHIASNPDRPATPPAGLRRGIPGSRLRIIGFAQVQTAEAPAAAAVAPPPTPAAPAHPQPAEVEEAVKTARVAFIVPHLRLPFGENLRLVGGGPCLGDWSAAAAPEMTWHEVGGSPAKGGRPAKGEQAACAVTAGLANPCAVPWLPHTPPAGRCVDRAGGPYARRPQ